MKKLFSILIPFYLLLSCQKEVIEKEEPKQDTVIVIKPETPKQIAYYNMSATFDSAHYEKFILSDTGKYTIKSGWRIKKRLYVSDGNRKANKELEPLGKAIVYFESGMLKIK